ncbi:hypothetical protein MKW92_002472 [Papaver armeniacum]|nr:hypothetical protein MKW92_002472 [Papaver armeniacum]
MEIPANAAKKSSNDREQIGHVDDQSGMPETDVCTGNRTSHPQAVSYPLPAPSSKGSADTQGLPVHHQQNAQPYPSQQTYAPPQNSQTNNPVNQQHPQQHQQPYPFPIHNYQGEKSVLPHQAGYGPTQQAYPQHAPPQMQTPPPTSPYQQQQHPAVGVPIQSQPMYLNKPTPVPTPDSYPPKPTDRSDTIAWTTGIFDCKEDPNNALMTLVLPCLTFGQIAEIIDDSPSTCTASGLMYATGLLLTQPHVVSRGYRSKLRKKYDLVEAPTADWPTHAFCELCALCQEYRELKNRGSDPAIGWYGNQMKLQLQQQEQQQVQMAPPMNQIMNG